VHLSGHYTVSGKPEQLYEKLQDPEILKQCLPGCEELVLRSDQGYDARLRIGLGLIRGTLIGQVELKDRDPPSRYTMEFKGQGRVGSVRGTTRFILEPTGNSSTRIRYESEVQLDGLIGVLGEKLFPGGARTFFDDLFSSLDRALQEGGA